MSSPKSESRKEHRNQEEKAQEFVVLFKRFIPLLLVLALLLGLWLFFNYGCKGDQPMETEINSTSVSEDDLMSTEADSTAIMDTISN